MILFKGAFGKVLFILTAVTFAGVCVREILGVNVNFYIAALFGIIGFAIVVIVVTVVFLLLSALWDDVWNALKEKWGNKREREA